MWLSTCVVLVACAKGAEDGSARNGAAGNGGHQLAGTESNGGSRASRASEGLAGSVAFGGFGDHLGNADMQNLGGSDQGEAGSDANAGSGSELGNAGTGDLGGGGDDSVWRPFSDDSPWNTAIAADPAIDAQSAAMIADLRTSSTYGSTLGVNIAQFSIPRFYAEAGAPKRLVNCNIGGTGFPGSNGMNASAMVPWPAGAMPDPASDHHLLIIDRETQTEWGMWRAVDSSGAVTCGLGATSDLTGTGVRPIAQGNPTWYTSHGARACGFPLVAGLILQEEIEAQNIEHALVIAYPHIRAGLYTPPASTAQATKGADAIKTRGIPCGGRIQYDPSIDVDSLDVSPAARTILRALQRYGAYVGDYSGSINLYAENSAEAQAYWDGVLSTQEMASKVDLADFRVLALGTLYDNGNGG